MLSHDGVRLNKDQCRVLAEADEVRERRDQARQPAYTKPEFVATGPNQVWSWDITKLKGLIKYVYFSVYVIFDLFSRYVVGWMVALNESARLAERLLEETCAKQGIAPHQLTIHADRGAPMRSNWSRCSSRIWASTPATRGRASATTTRFRKRNFGP